MALTAAASDFDNASAALQRWRPDHVKDLRMCLAKIADEPLPERAMAHFGIVLSQFTSCSESSASQEQVQMLLDYVFRPLAQYATSAPSVAGLFMTVHVVLETGSPEERKERRAIFTTRSALEGFLFPASSMVNDAELCHLYLRIIFQFSIDADCRALLAHHSEFRDRILILLAQCATTEEATHLLFIVLKNFLTCPEHCRVLSTPSVRDHIFVGRASFVTSYRCADEYFRALLPIVSQDMDADPNPRAALFKTQAVRDTVFLPLVCLVTDSNTLPLYLTCLCYLATAADAGKKTAPVFGTKAVRDRLIVPLVKHVTTEELACSFFLAIGAIARDCPPDSVWFTTTALRDRVILPIAKYCASTAATAIACCVAFAARDPAALAHLHTPKVRDAVFIPLARQNVNDTSPVAVVNEFCSIVTDTITRGAPPNAHASAVFATAAVRDEIIIPLAKVVTDTVYVFRLFRVLSTLTDSSQVELERKKTTFATPAIRDELFCRHAASIMSHDDAADVWNALASLINPDPQGTRRALFATARVRDKVLVPLFDYVSVGSFGSVLRAFRHTYRAVASVVESTTINEDAPPVDSLNAYHSFSEEVLIALAEKSTTGDGAARLAMTMSLC